MPPKRTKKAPAVPKVQGKLSFQRVQKPQTTVSPLVQILSQYQLMIMVTDQLSSADIIHLITTCKEIKMYLTDDRKIYNSIVSNANCDGKGIEARAKCFGHWKGDVTKATAQCGGSDCKPYDGCKAMVCNVSIFESSSTSSFLTFIRSADITSPTWRTCLVVETILRTGSSTKPISQTISKTSASVIINAVNVCQIQRLDLRAKIRLC